MLYFDEDFSKKYYIALIIGYNSVYDLVYGLNIKKIFEFADREIYEKTIDMKCINCDYDEITYGWNQINYPICYCTNCCKGTFIPLDIYNKKKL